MVRPERRDPGVGQANGGVVAGLERCAQARDTGCSSLPLLDVEPRLHWIGLVERVDALVTSFLGSRTDGIFVDTLKRSMQVVDRFPTTPQVTSR